MPNWANTLWVDAKEWVSWTQSEVETSKDRLSSRLQASSAGIVWRASHDKYKVRNGNCYSMHSGMLYYRAFIRFLLNLCCRSGWGARYSTRSILSINWAFNLYRPRLKPSHHPQLGLSLKVLKAWAAKSRAQAVALSLSQARTSLVWGGQRWTSNDHVEQWTTLGSWSMQHNIIQKMYLF